MNWIGYQSILIRFHMLNIPSIASLFFLSGTVPVDRWSASASISSRFIASWTALSANLLPGSRTILSRAVASRLDRVEGVLQSVDQDLASLVAADLALLDQWDRGDQRLDSGREIAHAGVRYSSGDSVTRHMTVLGHQILEFVLTQLQHAAILTWWLRTHRIHSTIVVRIGGRRIGRSVVLVLLLAGTEKCRIHVWSRTVHV